MATASPDSSRGKRAQRKEANKKANKEADLLDGNLKYIAMAIGALVGLSALAVFFTQLTGLVTGFRGIEKLDVTDASAEGIEKLKEVFFSGKPAVLYCTNEEGEQQGNPKILMDLLGEMRKDPVAKEAKIFTGDCFKPMPTGKTIAERFNFGKKPNFLAVWGPTKDEPLQLNYFTSVKQVLQQMKPMFGTGKAASIAQRVVYLKDFDRFKKLSRSVVLLGKTADKRKSMEEMLQPHFKNGDDKDLLGLKVFSIDSSFHHLSLQKDFVNLAPTPEESEYGDAICFLKDQDPSMIDALGEEMITEKKATDSPEGKKVSYFAQYLESWESDTIANFLKQCSGGEGNYDKIVAEAADIAVQEKTVFAEKQAAAEAAAAAASSSSTEDETTAALPAELDVSIVLLPGTSGKWRKLVRKPRLAAVPSEAKQVSAPSRPGMGGDGSRKGEGEKVGRRTDDGEENEEDLDDLDPPSPEDEVVEDVEI